MKFLHHRIGTLIWIAISIFVCTLSWNAEIGSWSLPGAGFFPFIAGILLGGVSLISGFREILGKGNPIPSYQFHSGKPVLVFAVLIIYTLFLKQLGYLIATFILFCFLFNAVPSREKRNWWSPIVGSLVTVLASYIVFDKVLLVLLPKGIFGF